VAKGPAGGYLMIVLTKDNKEKKLYRPYFPDKWEKKSLFELAEWKNGLAFKDISFSDYGMPVIKIAELKNGITSQTKFTNQVFDDTVFLKGNDMVFSWSGNPETSIDVFWYNLPDGWLNQHIFKITVKEKVEEEFFFYILKYLKPNFIRIASNKQTTGLGHVTISDLKQIDVRIPPLPAQRAIAATLSCLDGKIELNNRINANLEAQAQAIFKSWFVDFEPFKGGAFVDSELGRIPRGWRAGSFTSVVNILGGGTPKTNNSKYWGGNIPFFTPKDISGPFVITTERYVTQEGLESCNSKLYPENTVFVTARGTVGKIVFAGRDMAMSQTSYALVAKEDYSQYFVYGLVQEIVKRLKHKAMGAVFDAIVTRDFDSELVVIPPGKIVDEYSSVTQPLYSQILTFTRQSRTLAAIRDTLLPKLMSGEIEAEL
jgi:type I restriction enzyme S subunit